MINEDDDKERVFRSTYVPALASPGVQAIFTTALMSLGQAAGYDDVREFVTKEYDDIIYHFTLNFMGGHTVHHTDEPMADGPSKSICNVGLQGNGVVYFIQTSPRPDGSWSNVPAAGVWQRPGDAVVFSREARTFMQHGVIKLGPLLKLPEADGKVGDDNWDKYSRIVACLRLGSLPAKDRKDWDSMWANEYGLTTDNPAIDPTVKISPRKVLARLSFIAPPNPKPTHITPNTTQTEWQDPGDPRHR
jgi:hypothetical protein